MHSIFEMTKYILFCAQEANFQTRSMLIPYDLIMNNDNRVKDLQMLREEAFHNVEIEHRRTKYVIDQLLIHHDIEFDNNLNMQPSNPSARIIDELTSYADDLDIYLSRDEEWYTRAICNVMHGFNHPSNYINFRNKTEYEGKLIEIVEGFLVLENEDIEHGYFKLSAVGQ